MNPPNALTSLQDIDAVTAQAKADISKATTDAQLEDCRLNYLGKKGRLTDLFTRLRECDAGSKKTFGKALNEARSHLLSALKAKHAALETHGNTGAESSSLDLNLPGVNRQIGFQHPLWQVQEEILRVFNAMGFMTVEGPEVETEYYNFQALNIPHGHPARDVKDTLYLEAGGVLRTQTSPVQIRIMETMSPPLSVVSPGRVYRRDSIDPTHSPIFHQIEGFHVSKQVSFSDLKGLLIRFCKELFGEQIPVRFQPDYFPFTEPSCEVAIQFEGTWMEILGAGMIHPNVLKNVSINPEVYNGLAFGLGVERITMIKHHIQDIRLFYENDFAVSKQFPSY